MLTPSDSNAKLVLLEIGATPTNLAEWSTRMGGVLHPTYAQEAYCRAHEILGRMKNALLQHHGYRQRPLPLEQRGMEQQKYDSILFAVESQPPSLPSIFSTASPASSYLPITPVDAQPPPPPFINPWKDSKPVPEYSTVPPIPAHLSSHQISFAPPPMPLRIKLPYNAAPFFDPDPERLAQNVEIKLHPLFHNVLLPSSTDIIGPDPARDIIYLLQCLFPFIVRIVTIEKGWRTARGLPPAKWINTHRDMLSHCFGYPGVNSLHQLASEPKVAFIATPPPDTELTELGHEGLCKFDM
ncbi:hypothetical protein M422DRAFT_264198 [Sphaerobolus stellatus SS14]|uniref:Uncharacterized protein n=1 Tax=Sphaerobolus stellatus (strain SS14) TaxID=990650 RepID=A0A0C9V8U2_SPHS4|nr:hypothetical protein M422DRAFT_264198 [Sphaerobolus stellatus SS14]